MSSKPTEPTLEQLVYGRKLIRIAIGCSIAFFATSTILLVGLADLPAVPLVPIAVAIILVDLGFIQVFDRTRGQQIRAAEARQSGLEDR